MRLKPWSRKLGTKRSLNCKVWEHGSLPLTKSSASYQPNRASDRDSSEQHTGNRRRHQIGHGASQHGANAQLRQFPSFVGSERPDAAQLNSDRAQIGESAERERRNRKRARVEHGFLRSEHGEGYKFVQHHARPEEIADGGAVMPWNSDDPCHGGKQCAKDLLQTGGKPRDSKHMVNSTEEAVGEGDQREKGNQHGGDVERES